MEYKVELFEDKIDGDNKTKFEQILNKYAKDGWELEKIIPQVDSYSDSFEDASGFTAECCSNVMTDSLIVVFVKNKK